MPRSDFLKNKLDHQAQKSVDNGQHEVNYK